MALARIYNYDSATDGWKTEGKSSERKTVKIDMKQRGIQERDIEFTHYCKNGQTLCGETEGSGARFYNDSRNQCDECREGVRNQTKEAFRLRDAGDESKNVVDYAAAAKNDHPESATPSH